MPEKKEESKKEGKDLNDLVDGEIKGYRNYDDDEDFTEKIEEKQKKAKENQRKADLDNPYQDPNYQNDNIFSRQINNIFVAKHSDDSLSDNNHASSPSHSNDMTPNPKYMDTSPDLNMFENKKLKNSDELFNERYKLEDIYEYREKPTATLKVKQYYSFFNYFC